MQPVPPAVPGSAPPPSQAGAIWRPLSRAWRWGIAVYVLLVGLGVALAVLMSGGPGSTRLAVVVGVLQEPYLQLASIYRGQDDTAPDVEYVVFESEDERERGLHAYLQGRADMSYQGKGLLPGVSVVRIQRAGLKAALDDLHRQPFVTLVLKSRIGMICH